MDFQISFVKQLKALGFL